MKTKTKKIISSILIAANIAIPANITLAKSESRTHQEVKVYFNEEKIEFDQQPIIVDGRTKVPFRAIFETMGTVVYHRAKDNSILAITRDGDAIYHVIGTNKATKNGKEFTFDSTSELINDRTLIPVRMVADLLNAKVEWDGNTSEVDITKEMDTNEYHKKIRGILGCSIDKNFNPEDFKRYVSYQYKHWNMDPKQVILDVNMDLDRELVLKTITNPNRANFKIDLLTAKDEDITIIEDYNSNTALVNHFNRLPNDYAPKNLVNVHDFYKNDPDFIQTIEYGHVDNIKADAYSNYAQMMNEFIKYSGSRFFSPSDGYISTENFTKVFLIYSEQASYYLRDINKDLIHKYVSGNWYFDLQTGLSITFDHYSKEINCNEYKKKNGYEVNIPEYFIKRIKKLEWFKNNCHLYGFVQRYPDGKEHITRMVPNVMYYRYVGKDVAKIMHDENLCLEEYCAKYESKTSYKTDIESTKKKVLQKY